MAQKLRIKDWSLAERSDGKPVNIIEIHTVHGQTKKSKYYLKCEALRKLLEPIMNTEVVVIAVVGQSRRGKSFLLNYMCRFLADYKNINGWMGDGDKPLEGLEGARGFGWKSSDEPQTFGLWLSKPFIVKQSNGKEIAVLLMDTQGLFDDLYDQRDWSTIVGISLLVSSCLIVNVFTDISEDIMTTLNSYINYGLRAAEANAGAKESIPFQTLLFLIRDWNTSNLYKFGLSGGKQYLDKKLIVRDNQSAQAQNVRHNIGKCFKDIMCFLMPTFGEVMESQDFNGSSGQLRERFREKLKEFISTLLNPEELVPKMIDGTPITGDELLQQFQSFVEIFNGEEMPESKDLIEAKAKLSDNIVIRKLRDLHLSQLRAFVDNKPFVKRKDLEEKNKIYKSENIEDFESSMKSNNPKLVDKLYDNLKKNYENVFQENEEKRRQYMEDKRDMCGKDFMDALNHEIQKNGFVEYENLEEVFKMNEKKAKDSFNQCFGGEDEKLFEKDSFELNMFINNLEKAIRKDNSRRIKEFDKTKDESVQKVVNYYIENMAKLLEDNIYLAKQQFKESEIIVRAKTESKFKQEYDFGNPSANETFFLKVNQKLNESKRFFKDKNLKKCESIVKETETVISKSIGNYNKEMNERLYLINSEEDLDKSHRLVLSKVSEDLQNRLPFKAPYFVDTYIETFDRETNKLYDNYRNQLRERTERIHRKYVTALNDAKDHYIEGITESMEEKGLMTSEELNRIHKKYRKSALKVYENHFEENKSYDPLFKAYQADLKDNIDDEFDGFVEKNEENRNSDERIVETILNQSIDIFNIRMNEIIESVDNENQFSQNYSTLKEELKKEMSDNNTVSDKSLLNQSLFKLENNLNQSFNDFKGKLESKKASILKDYESKVTQAVNFYKQKISQMLENSEYVTDEELEEFHEMIRDQVISDLTNQLKPSFDLDVNQFIKVTEEMIGEEYQTYFVVNEAKRNNRWKHIQNVSQEFIDEYNRKISEEFDAIETDGELQAKHSRTLEEVLQKSRNSDLCNKKLISLQVTHIETEITKQFEDIFIKFQTRIKNTKEAYNLMFEKSKKFYQKKMDSLFENNEIYPNEELDKYQVTLKADTIAHFQNQLESNGLAFEQLKSKYLEDLSDFVDNTHPQYIRKNEEIRLFFNEKLNEKAELVKQKYSESMNNSIDSILSEADLNIKHYQLMGQLLAEFNDSIQLLDMTLLAPYQERLQSFMRNELSILQKNLSERIENIIKSYKSVSILLTEQYIQEMENIIKGEEILSDDELEGLHNIFSTDVIKEFESHLKANPCAETQTYFLQFKQTIEEEALKIKERFQLRRDLKLRNLDIAINEFTVMYESEMKDNQKNVRTIEELKDCHQQVKDKLIRVFKTSYRFHDESKMVPYIETLDQNFDISFNDFEVILELRIEKQETLTRNLRLEVRRYYKEEMQKYFQNKLYVQKPVFNKCHKLVVRNTIEKYSSEIGDLSEESFKALVEESIADIFTKIDEENEMKKPTQSPPIGIDLGTTNSCVAYFNPITTNPNNVVVIPNEFGHPTTPSVVSYRNNSILSVGEEAKDAIHAYHRNTVSSVKRLIGRNYNDENVQNDMNLWSYKVVDDGSNNPKVSVKVDGQDLLLYPEQISAKVLKKMKELAESHLGCEVTKAVITVPAYFNDGQKEATKDAGRLAGLEVLRIINEPTAAAIAFKVDRNEEREIRNVLIFDFGGGTFDVSILEINRGKIIVKAVGGDNHLGGDDIDTNIIKYCLEQFFNEFNLKPEGVEGEIAMCRLRNECEKHKKKLTAVESTIISIDNFYKRHDLRVVLTRDKFEELNDHLFVRSINLVKSTLDNVRDPETGQLSAVNPSHIDDVVLVGGTTRIPKVQELLSQFFGGKPLNHWVNPDEAVAKGAAIQAAYINGQQIGGSTELELKDVTPLSLGIRIKGGKMSVIIPRNSPVPTTVTKQYFTSEDYQTVVGIKIFEGEKEIANDNHLLGQFDLSGIPSAPQGEQPIDVTFSLNDEGILHVIAKIVSTGGVKDIEITEHKGRLTTELIEQLIAQENNQYFGNLFN